MKFIRLSLKNSTVVKYFIVSGTRNYCIKFWVFRWVYEAKPTVLEYQGGVPCKIVILPLLARLA